jgi:NAD-dependent deacetylase
MNATGIGTVTERLRRATRVTVLTGAGVSAASGVPTFRGSGGLWRSFRAESLATPEAFERDPRLVWEWYDWRRQRLASCHPNRAHEVLASWAARWPACTIITQNVDGLHERAGLRDVVRLHGSIWEVSCWSNCAASPASWHDETVPLPECPLRCRYCGGLARPAVVWFGEALDAGILSRALSALDCDLFITAGTSAIVHPAAGFLHTARRHGAFTIEVNPESTPATSSVDLAIQQPAEIAFDAFEQELSSSLQKHRQP